MLTNVQLIEKLKALGACRDARDWVKMSDRLTAQQLWEQAEPIHMLWLLRRTCVSYRSKKLRCLVNCLLEVVSTIDPDRAHWPGERRAERILSAFADGQADTEDVYSEHLCLGSMSGKLHPIMESISKQEAVSRYLTSDMWLRFGANTLDDLSLKDKEWAREIILRHFPKPPRLS